MITYQMKINQHEKCIAILDLIKYANKRQYNQKENLKAWPWINDNKFRHQIEITDLAIARLKIYYNNQLTSIKPLCTE